MSSRDKNEVHKGNLALILIGLFLGFGANVFLAMHTFVTIDFLFLLFLFTGTLVMGIYFIIHRERKRYWFEMIALCYIGWASLILALLLSLNYLFHRDMVTTRYVEEVRQDSPVAGIMIKDSSYRNFRYLLYFEELESFDPEKRVKEIDITTATGLFGYRVVLDKEIIYE